MSWAIPPLPQYAFMVWYLVKHRDNFTFYFKKLEVGYIIKMLQHRVNMKFTQLTWSMDNENNDKNWLEANEVWFISRMTGHNKNSCKNNVFNYRQTTMSRLKRDGRHKKTKKVWNTKLSARVHGMFWKTMESSNVDATGINVQYIRGNIL
jgi:hypothetical protein